MLFFCLFCASGTIFHNKYIYKTFLLLDPEIEAQVSLPSSARYTNGWPYLQRGTSIILAAVVIFRCSGYTSMMAGVVLLSRQW